MNTPLTPQALTDSQKATEWLYSTAFSPDKRFLAVAYGGGNLKIWETFSGRLLMNESIKFKDPNKKATAIAFSSDGQWLVTGSDNGELFAGKVESTPSQPYKSALTATPTTPR